MRTEEEIRREIAKLQEDIARLEQAYEKEQFGWSFDFSIVQRYKEYIEIFRFVLDEVDTYGIY